MLNNNILVLQTIKPGEIPSQIPLFHVNIWVQVYDLPVGFMSTNVGKQLGNFIGLFVDYDVNNNIGFWRNYVRLQVKLDVRQPLKRCKKITLSNRGWSMVKFKYERLEKFCYLCGIIGHNDSFYPLLFTNHGGLLKQEWG